MWDDQFEQILRTFLPFLPPQEPLTTDDELKDLGLDSLGMVQPARHAGGRLPGALP